MARIRFLSDQVYATEGPGKGPMFAKDATLDEDGVGAALGRDVSPEWAGAFLRRWLQRGVAVEISPEVADAAYVGVAPVEDAPDTSAEAEDAAVESSGDDAPVRRGRGRPRSRIPAADEGGES